MKKNVALSIPTPCSEQWGDFSPTPSGGHCSVCTIDVVDFTMMSDQEIVDFFVENKGFSCGKMRPEQLKCYGIPQISWAARVSKFLKVGLLGITLLGWQHTAYTKELPEKQFFKKQLTLLTNQDTVAAASYEGMVIDEMNGPLPGVNVYVKGTTNGTVTDIDGQFKISHALKEGDVLVFSSIGYNTEELLITAEMPALITLEMKMYVALLGMVATEDIYVKEPSKIKKFWRKVKGVFE